MRQYIDWTRSALLLISIFHKIKIYQPIHKTSIYKVYSVFIWTTVLDYKYLTFWKRQIYRDSRKIGGVQGLGEKGMNEQVQCRAFFRWRNYSLPPFNGAYKMVCICQNTQNCKFYFNLSNFTSKLLTVREIRSQLARNRALEVGVKKKALIIVVDTRPIYPSHTAIPDHAIHHLELDLPCPEQSLCCLY